jgi:flagellar basal body rod protein FlgG
VRMDHANDPMSVAAPERTYFIGTDAQGRRFYTRNGVFHLANGVLRTQNGSSVLGFPPGHNQLTTLRQDPVDAVLKRGQDERIAPDGTVSYLRNVIDPKTGAAKPERVVIGRVALARFPAATELHAPDGVHVTAPAGIEPSVGLPSSETLGALAVNRIDRGSYDVKAGINELRTAYMQLDAMRAADIARRKTEKTVGDLIK